MIPWTKWLTLAIGVWVLISPFVAEKIGLNLTWSNILSGAVVATVVIWDLFGKKNSPTINP